MAKLPTHRLPSQPVQRLHVLCAAALLMGAAWSGSSHASDAHAAPPAAKADKAAKADAHGPAAKPAAKDAHGAAPKADAHGAAPKADAHGAPPAKAAAAEDPMDTLREKLASKLGAAKVPEAPTPYVVRVVSKAGEPAHGTAAAHVAATAPAHGGTPTKVAKLRSDKAAVGQVPNAHAAHWSYGGEGGPEAWGQLKPEFATCATGSRQSPIDIRSGVKVDLEPIQFDYRPTGFSVVDNGHTIQVNLGGGNSIEVQGRRFDLLQFHFHRPSEERVNGRQFDMVAHLVHKDPEGRLAVVAVLLDRGSVQPLVQTIWNNLPLEKGTEQVVRSELDMNQLLPADRRYFTYMGSLTTPPCSEGVLWMVLQQPVPVATEQVNVFSRLYPMNARPIQQAGGRLIKQSN
jgi:carbonic anhydrase